MIKDIVDPVSSEEAKSVLSSFCRYNDWRYDIDDCKVLGRSKLDDNLYLVEVIDEGKQYIFNSMRGKIDPNAKFMEAKNMNKIEPVQNLELSLVESFEKTIKSLQKEGLFKNVESFDLSLKNNQLNIKLNEGTYEWGANFGHSIDSDREDNEDNPDYIAKPDKLFKSEEAAIRACEKYYDANPRSYSEVLRYYEDEGWQVTEEYDGWYN